MASLEAGVHIKAVADLLGHSSITGDIYGYTSDATTRAAGIETVTRSPSRLIQDCGAEVLFA
jgi:integrase